MKNLKKIRNDWHFMSKVNLYYPFIYQEVLLFFNIDFSPLYTRLNQEIQK